MKRTVLLLLIFTAGSVVGGEGSTTEKDAVRHSFSDVVNCHGKRYRVTWDERQQVFLETVVLDRDTRVFEVVHSLPLELTGGPRKGFDQIKRVWLIQGGMSRLNLTGLLEILGGEKYAYYAFRVSIPDEMNDENKRTTQMMLVDQGIDKASEVRREIVAMNDSPTFGGLSIFFAEYAVEKNETRTEEESSHRPTPARLRHYQNISFVCPPINETLGVIQEFESLKDLQRPLLKREAKGVE